MQEIQGSIPTTNIFLLKKQFSKLVHYKLQQPAHSINFNTSLMQPTHSINFK